MTPETAASTGFRHFHDQLATLKARLLTMSQIAEQRTEVAVDALLTRDAEKAELVIEGDAELNNLEVEVEQLGVELLALQQPMARDLRFIIGAIKVSNDLERVGDHAVNIAESALRLISGGSEAEQTLKLAATPEIEDMARRARKMLSDSLDAFLRADGALGRQVCREDDVVDALHDSVFRVLLTHMMGDPSTITPSLQRLLVSRNLERIADLATNIGEDAVYLAEGKQIKHHYKEGNLASIT
ncbi:MAG TPA: phosphate signaling complex protein PhoU [Gemmatimonadaceae bacterium]|nr:phosphate signaling complex protein PhoU [Gemmatimonadaceae bacterium]